MKYGKRGTHFHGKCLASSITFLSRQGKGEKKLHETWCIYNYKNSHFHMHINIKYIQHSSQRSTGSYWNRNMGLTGPFSLVLCSCKQNNTVFVLQKKANSLNLSWYTVYKMPFNMKRYHIQIYKQCDTIMSWSGEKYLYCTPKIFQT